MSLIWSKPAAPEARAVDASAFIRGDETSHAKDRALRLTPVFAAVSLLADGVASLPLQAYRVGADGVRERTASPPLFKSPAASGTLYDWIHRAMVSLLLRGNAYGLVTRTVNGFPASIEWLHPDRVFVNESSGSPRYYVDRRLVDPTEILHIVGFAQPGTCVGLSPIENYAMTLDMGLSAQKSARDWFKNGEIPSNEIIIDNAGGTISPEVARGFKDQYMATVRSGEPFVHGTNVTMKAIGLSAADAQFLDAITASATHIAAIYHLAPEDIGGERGSSLTYSTTELDEIKLQTRSLRPWVTRFEQAFGQITPRPIYMRFNYDANIRTEIKARWETHQIALSTGARTINEIRQIEDLPPVPWGNEPWTPRPAPNPAATRETGVTP